MGIKALTFDVFGTVVDWRSAIIEEMAALGAQKGVEGDWAVFTDAWKACYRPAMEGVNDGSLPWTNVDKIFRDQLELLLPEYGLEMLREAERAHLNLAWCRPIAWPDSVPGLAWLRSRYVLSTLSNGNFAWLVAITKHCDLPFDCVLTAENARAYKPDPKIYHMAIDLLGLAPEEVLMVACHNYDLAAARSHGMRTAFFPRKETGSDQTTDQAPESDWDYVVSDLEELAAALDC